MWLPHALPSWPICASRKSGDSDIVRADSDKVGQRRAFDVHSRANTVRNSLAQVFRKVGVSRRSELVYIVQNSTDTDVLRSGRSGPTYQRNLDLANILKGSPSPLSVDPCG